MLEISAAVARQYIDAVSVFEALEEALGEALQVRGGMYWHAGPPSNPQASYLVRTTPAGGIAVQGIGCSIKLSPVLVVGKRLLVGVCGRVLQ